MTGIDDAARHLAQLKTGSDRWDGKNDRLRDQYRDQVRHLVALAGAVFLDDPPPAQPPETSEVTRALLDHLAAGIEELLTRTRPLAAALAAESPPGSAPPSSPTADSEGG